MNTLPSTLTMTHDPVVAFEHLVRSASDYLEEMDLGVPYGRRLVIAAVAFTVQVAVEYGYDVETIRAMERDLIARLESEA